MGFGTRTGAGPNAAGGPVAEGTGARSAVRKSTTRKVAKEFIQAVFSLTMIRAMIASLSAANGIVLKLETVPCIQIG